MKIKFFLWLFIFLSVHIHAQTPEIQHWEGVKGSKVLFFEAHELPIVDIQIIFDAGSARDPKGKNGLALLTNGLLDEGAAGLDANAISFEFEKLGANYSSDAAYDSASVSLRSLSDKDTLDKALENLNRVLSKPDFPEDAFQRQRNRTLVGITHKKQSPGELVREAFYAAVYGDHPYALPNEGSEDTVKALRRTDVKDFYQRYYTAANATVAIVGDLNTRRAKQLANKLMTSLPRGKVPEPLPEVSALTSSEEININHPSTQTHILMGQPGMKRGDPDYFVLYVGNHILGGSGMVSRLYNDIREDRGLAYSVYSYFSPMRENGPFFAGMQTRGDQATLSLQLLEENISAFIENGPAQEELIAAKNNITGGFPLRIDSNRDILGYVGLIGFYNLPLNYLDVFNEKIEAVTIEQIKEAFQRRLSPEKMVKVMVGPIEVDAAEGTGAH